MAARGVMRAEHRWAASVWPPSSPRLWLLPLLAGALSLAGCAARLPARPIVAVPAPRAAPAPTAALVGVVVALRPVPADALGVDPAAFRAARMAAVPPAAGPAATYTEVVIRTADGHTCVVMQPQGAGLAPGEMVRLTPGVGVVALTPAHQ
jgi:hypothetical protein